MGFSCADLVKEAVSRSSLAVMMVQHLYYELRTASLAACSIDTMMHAAHERRGLDALRNPEPKLVDQRDSIVADKHKQQ